MFFKCSHKFKHLAVFDDSSIKDSEEYPHLAMEVTHHLFCRNCNKRLDIKYASLKGGVEGFLKGN